MRYFVLVAVVFAGCSSGSTVSPLTGGDAAPNDHFVAPQIEAGNEAAAVDVVRMPVAEAAADVTMSDDEIDAVDAGYDANREAPTEDVAADAAPDVSGDWLFNFIGSVRGQMTLAPSGSDIAGTYLCAGGCDGTGPIHGTFDGTTLSLTWSGVIVGSCSGPVIRQTDGTLLVNNVPAMLAGASAVFWARH